MLGIVVVSHSSALAHAARDLALQMTPGDQPVVACAGGLDETTLGTDATRIVVAITEADSPDGVLVLMDLGSAVLSAEMACELLEPEVAARVTLSSAPLVEGLVAAVVMASSGASMAEVVAEAAAGLQPKTDHLGDGSPSVPEGAARTEEWQRLSVVVPNRLGLHARPAAALVRLMASSGAQTQIMNVSRDIGPASGTSLVSVAGLNASQGDELEIRAAGSSAAVRTLFSGVKAFVENNFGDDPEPPVTPATRVSFSGPVVRLSLDPTSAPPAAGDPATEGARFDAALESVRGRLTDLVARARRDVSDDAAEMVAAQLVFLDDAGVLRAVRERIAGGGSAADAWTAELDRMRGLFAGMSDDYMRAREQDVWSLQQRMLRTLAASPEPEVDRLRGVVITQILDAPTAVLLDPEQVAGVVTAEGGTLGHGAMIAAARGIALAADMAGRYDAAAEGSEITVEQ